MAEKEKEYFFEYKIGFMQTVAGIIFFAAVGLFGWLYYKLYDFNPFTFGLTKTMVYMAIFYVVMFAWMVLHELIHGSFYILNGAKKENVTYGAALEKGIFYCRCGEYVDKKNIMMSLMAPFTIIGVITLIIGFLIHSFTLVMLSAINIGGAGGDLCMFFFFIKRKKDVKFKEYGDSSIFSLKTTEDLDNKKFIAVNQIDASKAPENDNTKKIVISKGSKRVALFFLIIIVLLIVEAIGFGILLD